MRRKFLLEPPQRGYPEEYLLSRIRGCRSRLLKDWSIPLYSPDPAGFIKTLGYEFSDSSYMKPLLKRYRWFYSEMNEQLRERFWPYFFLFELRTLFTCLRFVKAGDYKKAEGLFRLSLLSEEIKDSILSSEGFEAAIEKLTGPLSEGYRRFEEGLQAFHSRGLQGLERFIYEITLEYLMSLDLEKKIRSFITYQIDSRNILNLYRSIKWESRTIPEFIQGGEIDLKDLERIAVKRDLILFSGIIKKLTGFTGDNVEDLLLKGLTRRLRKISYEPDGTGLILHYLWSLYIELRNLGTLLSATGIERTELMEEII